MEAYGWLIWLVLMVVFAALEAATVNLVSIWFVGGSLAALVTQLLGGSGRLQTVVFLLVSVILLALLRPFVRRYVQPKRTATNADMVLGREARLTEPVDNLQGTGALKLDGKEWTARSVDDTVLEAGTLVRVVKLEGVKLLVERASGTAGV